MPPVSHPFKKGALVILLNHNDHPPPHMHLKYHRAVKSNRIDIRTRKWLKPGKPLPRKLKKMVEAWVLMKKNYWNNGKELKIMTLLES